ncbi:MAG: bifunctional diguanylate cyclase/phosphodiesterase, partial [Planctomycetota bacterium]
DDDNRSGPLEGLGKRSGGDTFPLGVSSAELTIDGQHYRIGLLWDISARHDREAELHHQATHDPLTGLGNRAFLEQHSDDILQGEAPAALLLLELDRLRDVNDSLGHQTGDLMLQCISQRLKGALPPSCILVRLDGAQFAALLPNTSEDEASKLAGRVVQAVRSPFEIYGLSLQAELTVGIATYPEHATEIADLVAKGDVALYLARKSRKKVATYQSELDLNSTRHLALKGELQRAVEEDHLVLYYQPKILASTNRITGVEALVRWQHPTQGLVFPDDFIPLAEHTGLIRSITRWVLQAAFRQSAEWEKAGIILPISVNCSARNLQEEDLPETIARYLKEFGVPPERLTLEVTETMLIENPERALEVATLLTDQGIRISIDDFGTGYSSLNYLRKLPAKELKIDKSFVMRMDEEEGDAVIVRSIIDLAHNLGLKAIAEGVETGAVWSRLQSLGCDTGQGYFFARPIPVEVLAEWMRTSAWGLPLEMGRQGGGWGSGRMATQLQGN